MLHRVLIRAALCLLVAFVPVACDQPTPPLQRTGQPRVVSLAPALSQMIVDMGKADLLVGVAQYDTSAPAGLPVVGNYLDLNTEKLLSVKPTLVLMMTGKAGTPAALEQLAQQQGFGLAAWPSPLSIDEVFRVLHNPGSPKQDLGEALNDEPAARAVRERLERRLNAIRTQLADAPRRSVLMVIGTGPLMASGPGTTHDQLLTQYLQADNAAASASVTAPVFDREKLITLAPDVILMILPESPPLGTIDSDPRLAELRGLAIPAVERHRIVLIDHPKSHLPSSSLDQVAAAMARAIHPEHAAALNAIFEPAGN